MTDQANDGEGWALLDPCWWVREAGLSPCRLARPAPGGQTGINHDDGPGSPYVMCRASCAHVKLWRALAHATSGEPAILSTTS